MAVQIDTRDGTVIVITRGSRGETYINGQRVWSFHQFIDAGRAWIHLNTPGAVYVVALYDYRTALQVLDEQARIHGDPNAP